MEKTFSAFEYGIDEKFHLTQYVYKGDEENGWQIYREGRLHLTLGRGYRLLKTRYCGICSTDIARAKLPFALPQITGHEVVASHNGVDYLVEINASHKARGVDYSSCYFCSHNMDVHCPDRLTLGIDRLPGGFAPYLLAPRNALCAIPGNLSVLNAVITEPFAAAYHAVTSTMQKRYRSVAIVGPRRLGSLLLLALKLYRKEHALDFKVTAIVRNTGLTEFCSQAGADEVMSVSESKSAKFDVVFDTSGSVQGFNHALSIANKMVHVKSTNGEEAAGLRDLTAMVINENSIYPAALDNVTHLLDSIAVEAVNSVVLDESIPNQLLSELVERFPQKEIVKMDVNRFSQSCDVAVVSGVDQLSRLTQTNSGDSILRPRAKVFLFAIKDRIPKDELEIAVLQRGIAITASRCGSFRNALEIMRRHPKQIDKFCELFISDVVDIDDLNRAFEEAKNNRDKIKVVMKFDT